jgi:uncharacterized protein YggU (UPF0235/DUF167 family)
VVAGALVARRRFVALSRLRVRLTPSGGADRIDGIDRDEAGLVFLKARVRAAPEKGEANAALEKLLAKALGVAKSNVQVARGTTARLKTIEIEGVRESELRAFLDQFAEHT